MITRVNSRESDLGENTRSFKLVTNEVAIRTTSLRVEVEISNLIDSFRRSLENGLEKEYKANRFC